MKPLTTTFQTSYVAILMKLLALALVAGLAIVVYSQWGTFVTTTLEWQKTLHEMLAAHINAVSENVLKFGGALVALSFGYGVFHAVGPGHGKAVIVTYLGTNKESVWKGIGISFAAAILQSVLAIILVSFLAKVLKFRLAEVHNYGNDIAFVSYVLVMLLGAMLVITSLMRIRKSRRSKVALARSSHTHGRSHEHELSDSHYHHHHDHGHAHHHDSDCSCSHTHVPARNESVWQTLMVILSMGIRPCSGAIVVLIYAHLVGVYSYGVIATLMMGIGTGLSVSLLAIVTLYARTWLERFVDASGGGNGHSHMPYSHYVRGFGGIILIALGWSLYTAASAISSAHPLF